MFDKDSSFTPVAIKNKLLRRLVMSEGATCKYMYQKGPLKGEYCGKEAVDDGRCGIHLNRLCPLMFKCEAISREGIPCEVLTTSKYHKCKRHKKTLAWKNDNVEYSM